MENKYNNDRKIVLNNGLEIPCIGIGTYQIRKKSEIENVIKIAYNTGYRLFDTAVVYGNEKLIGDALKKLKIPRKEIFIVTKIFKGDMTYEKAKKSIESSLKKLQSDYIDMAYNTPRDLKKKYGKIAYILYGIKQLGKKIHRYDIKYKIDGKEYIGVYSFILFIK